MLLTVGNTTSALYGRGKASIYKTTIAKTEAYSLTKVVNNVSSTVEEVHRELLTKQTYRSQVSICWAQQREDRPHTTFCLPQT